jgi:ankyrin repeat protein
MRRNVMLVLAVVSLSALLSAAGGSPVADAAMAKDAAAVRALLKSGADVNGAQGDGMTALHWAAMHGDAPLVQMLLYAGANVRATTRLGGYTALHLASRAGAVDVVKTLAAGGADVNTPTSTGATPLMLAATSGSADATNALLEVGAQPNATETANGETALMFAAALDRAEVIRLLLQRGADARISSAVLDRSGVRAPEDSLQQEIRDAQNAKSSAVTGAARPAPPTPAAAAAAVAGVTRPFTFNELIGQQGGLTALHFAARQGAMHAVQALVDGGADIDQVSPADRTSPLLIATINGHFDAAKYLLDHGANPNLASEAGMTPLYAVLNVEWAAKMFYPQPRAHLQQETGYLDLARALLDNGADPDARVKRKIWYTQYNFDLLRVDESGASPFWRAAYASDIAAMKLLREYGADPNIPTAKPAPGGQRQGGTRSGDDSKDSSGLPPVPTGGPGIPPLLAAAGVGYGEGFAANAHRFAPTGMLAAVRFLVDELHVDVNARDHEGNTALHHAAARGDNEMIEYLVSKGADVRLVNRIGQTTVDMANGPVQRVQPYPETIALLERLGAKNNHKCVSC